MKRVMVLGAGRGQIPIINICHKFGWEVIVVSPEGNYPGFSVAEKKIYEDVRNKESLLQKAKELKINAVLTEQLDEAVLTAAYIAENMGISGITTEVALKFTNKYVMRKSAEKAGISVPRSVRADSVQEAENQIERNGLKFPLMMKPVDSAASRGVYKVSDIKELKERFSASQHYSKNGQIIIEEFIDGTEYVVEAFTSDGQTTNLIVGHRDYFNIDDAFIPNATVFLDANSASSLLEKRLKDINKQLVERFGLKFGITHGEYIYNAQRDEIFLVEIAARGGGVFIASDLIPAACGVDAEELLVKETLGIGKASNILLQPGAAAYFCYLVPEGEIVEIDGIEKVKNTPGVIKAFFDNVYVGMKTGSIKDKSARKGPILVKGKTKRECYDIIGQVHNDLIVKTLSQERKTDIIWN